MASVEDEARLHERGQTRVQRPEGDGGGSRPLWILVGLALALLGAGAILVSTSFGEPREAKPLGPNLPVNEGASNALDLSAHNSPSLVRNPRDAANLAVADRIDSPRYSCSLSTSFDGGGHWSQTPIPAPVGEEPKCFAPDVAFGSDGTLYLLFVTLKGKANAPHAAWVVTSRDGGKTLSAPARAPLGTLPFQARLTADPTRPRRLYVTWLKASDVGLYKFTETGNPIMSIRSENGGRTWTSPVQVSGPVRERVVAPSPAIGPKGELYVAYLDLGQDRLDYEGTHRGRGGAPYDGKWQLVVARSRDRGGSWEESVAERSLTPSERFVVFTPPSPSVAVDSKSGRVYTAFQDSRLGDPDVWVWSLPKDSKKWKAGVRVNDTKRRDGTAQYLPKLATSPDGRLDAVYYDRRGDRSNVLNHTSMQSSYDDGKSFAGRVRLSDRPFSSRIGFGIERNLPDLGSRLALISTNDRALAVWTDTRAGSKATSKQDLARRVVAFNDPPRLAGWLEFLLRWGGPLLILLGVAVLVIRGLGVGRSARA